MTMLKIQSTRKNEKGIALVFTLVMLSLLMILALSFALDSMFSQKAAYNSASVSSASFSAQAQLKQVLSLIQYYNGDLLTNSSIYSGGGSTGEHDTTDHDRDMLLQDLTNVPPEYNSRLLTEDRITKDNIISLCFSESLVKNRIAWSYHRDANNNIIGRTAFVVIPDHKIPINSLISKTVDESGGAVVGPPEVYNEKRIGKNVSEINIRKVMYKMNTGDSAATYTITPAMADIFNWLKTESDVTSNRDAGKFTGTWTSYSKIFGPSVLNLESEISDKDDREKFKQNFMNSFELDCVDDKEAFWAEASSGDRKIVDSELYQRFNLARSDWDTADNTADLTFIKNNILLDSDGNGEPDLGMTPWSNSTNLNGLGIPWLACFGYKDDTANPGNWIPDEALKGTFAYVKDRRYQIAANLKDYCDSDSRPTSDVNPKTSDTGDTWLNAAPTYTGNERTPYIDKLGVKLDAVQVGTSNGTDYDISATIHISVGVGLVNMYGTAWTAENMRGKVEGKVKVETTIEGSTASTNELSFSCFLDFSDSDWSGAYSRFVVSIAEPHVEVGKKSGFPNQSKKITLVVKEVIFTKVYLYKGDANDNAAAATPGAGTGTGDGYDYLNNINQTIPANSLQLNASEAAKTSWCGYAVLDPRQNLNNEDWKVLTPGTDIIHPNTVLAVTGSNPYYGVSNSSGPQPTEAPSTGPDVETSDETGLSTAHIRNAPMESPWELGLIHRGAKWETINLKTYDKTKAVQLVKIPAASGKNYIPGGGAYTSGDANILDQIKMTAEAQSPQKINLKTSNVSTLNALLNNVCLKGGVGDMSISDMSSAAKYLDAYNSFPTISGITKKISGDGAAIPGDGILGKYSTASPSDILTRASVVDKLLLPVTGYETDYPATNDAAQEELIGKIVNLTKVSSGVESFTVIVLAQTIKDIGGAGTDIDISRTSADGSVTGPVSCRLGRFDVAGSGGSNWKKNLYGDEITGEQKIMAKCRVINGKINIVKFQYCE